MSGLSVRALKSAGTGSGKSSTDDFLSIEILEDLGWIHISKIKIKHFFFSFFYVLKCCKNCLLNLRTQEQHSENRWLKQEKHSLQQEQLSKVQSHFLRSIHFETMLAQTASLHASQYFILTNNWIIMWIFMITDKRICVFYERVYIWQINYITGIKMKWRFVSMGYTKTLNGLIVFFTFEIVKSKINFSVYGFISSKFKSCYKIL